MRESQESWHVVRTSLLLYMAGAHDYLCNRSMQLPQLAHACAPSFDQHTLLRAHSFPIEVEVVRSQSINNAMLN